MPVEQPRVSVVVPTYRRPELLARCLTGIRALDRPADEIVVVSRADDADTARHLAGAVDLTTATVDEPGVLAAMNAGVAASRGDVVAFVDDDAVPRPTWLTGILRHLANPVIGGVGGRDVVHGLPFSEHVNDGAVGVVTQWGKLIGNHHLGSGEPRDVMVLKAVNMAFRREALALPRTLRGSGAQAHFEVATGLWALQHGWRLVYDPTVLVDHYPGPRFDPDRREHPDRGAVRDASYNLVSTIVSLRPELSVRRALYGILVGDAMTPGLARATVAIAQRDPGVFRRLPASLRGQFEALLDARAGRAVVMVPAAWQNCENGADKRGDGPQ